MTIPGNRKGEGRLWFGCFWLLTVLLYLPSWKGGFYEDFTSYVIDGRRMSLWEYTMLPNYSLYQGVNLVHYIFVWLFDTNRFLYFLAFTALHAVVGITAYYFFVRLQMVLALPVKKIYTIAGALLFIVSPMAMEPVVWKACSHYTCSAILLLLVLTFFLRYLSEGRLRYLWFSLIIYYLSTFFLEYFFLTIGLIPVLILAVVLKGGISAARARKSILTYYIPMLLIFGVYFLTFKMVIGNAVPRVDGLGNDFFTAGNILGRLGKFCSRLFLTDVILPVAWRYRIYSFAMTGPGMVTTLTLLVVPAVGGLLFFRKMSSSWQYTWLLLVLTCVSMAILFPMWFEDDTVYVSTRYFYLSSIFVWQFFIWMIAGIFRKHQWIFAVSAVLFVWMVQFTFRTTRSMAVAFNMVEDVTHQIRKWEDKKEIIVLGVPAYFNKIPSVGSGKMPISNIRDFMNVFERDTLTAKVYEVASFNMYKEKYGIKVRVLDDTHIDVSFVPEAVGVWFHHSGLGMTEQDNEIYKAVPEDNASWYRLEIKKKYVPGETVLLFYNDGVLKEVDMTKRNVDQQ